MNEGIKITGLKLRGNPVSNKSGVLVLAYFDFASGPIAMGGCTLAKYSNGQITIWPPKLGGTRDQFIFVRFTDKGFTRYLKDAACKAYIDLGGDPGLLETDHG